MRLEIPAEEVARIDRANRAARAAALRGAGPMSTPALRVAHDPLFGATRGGASAR